MIAVAVILGILLALSMMANGVLSMLIYACWHNAVKVDEQRQRDKVLLDAAIAELAKRQQAETHVVNTNAKVISISRRIH